MSRCELAGEIESGVAFSGWQEADGLAWVMGIQAVEDVTLIRHAYVRRRYQGRGIATELLATLAQHSQGQLLVGTWADAQWAIRLYQKHGFRLVSPQEKDRLLQTYWRIPPHQAAVSVVLELRTAKGLAKREAFMYFRT